MKDITFGFYYPGESFIHKLDPRTKFICTMFFLISLFTYRSASGYMFAYFYIIAVIICAKIPARIAFQGVKPISVLLLATLIFQALTGEGNSIVDIWIFHITYQSIGNAVYMALRILALVIGAALLSYTTTPTEVADAVEDIFAPLTKIKVPVHDLAFMVTSALKFIPILLEEANRITNAQISRGVEFDEKNVFGKMAALVPILIPIFVSAFQRAGDLSVAMDSRCYRGGEYRTEMNPLSYSSADRLAYIVMAVYLTVNIVTGKIYPILTF